MINAFTTIKGNIGKMEAQYTPQGKLFVRGSIAVSIGFGDNKETDWYDFVIWEKSAELFQRFCKVGTGVLVMGRQRIKKWESREGRQGTSVEITLSDFEVLRNGVSREEREGNPYDEDAVAVDQMLDG
jgi:single-strand DNA-binding protein